MALTHTGLHWKCVIWGKNSTWKLSLGQKATQAGHSAWQRLTMMSEMGAEVLTVERGRSRAQGCSGRGGDRCRGRGYHVDLRMTLRANGIPCYRSKRAKNFDKRHIHIHSFPKSRIMRFEGNQNSRWLYYSSRKEQHIHYPNLAHKQVICSSFLHVLCTVS